MQKQTQNLNWSFVEAALDEGTVSGYKMAIIETEKIFSQALCEKGFLGKDVLKQYQKAKHIFKNSEKIERANAMFKKIISHPGFDISAEDTKEIIKNIHGAISELEKLGGNSGFFKKIAHKINSIYQGTVKKWFFYFAGFCFGTLFLSETSLGEKITLSAVNFVRFITFKIVVPAGLIILAGYILIAAIKYFKTRN
ncbi:MAG: hypothetical protein V1698_03470 [bacterium]